MGSTQSRSRSSSKLKNAEADDEEQREDEQHCEDEQPCEDEEDPKDEKDPGKRGWRCVFPMRTRTYLSAPSLEPDCIWKEMTPDSPVPDRAIFHNEKLNGDDVYIGRTYHNLTYYIGTAIPKKNICIFLTKNHELKSSSEYEILTVGEGYENPLEFLDVTSPEREKRYHFPAGMDEELYVLHVGRYVDSKGNTYYGWMHRENVLPMRKLIPKVFIPRDPSEGPQVIDKDIAVLMHYDIHAITRSWPWEK